MKPNELTFFNNYEVILDKNNFIDLVCYVSNNNGIISECYFAFNIEANKLFKNKANTDQKRSPLNSNRLRYPGESLDNEIGRIQNDYYIYLTIALLILVFTFLECFYSYFNVPRQPVTALIISAVVLPYCYVKIRKLRKLYKNAKLGRDGEREVGQALEELRADGYAIFHDIVGENFNVDHVVVSPNGIFVLETKTYSKSTRGSQEITFDGRTITRTGEQPDEKPVKQAIINAEWIQKILKESTGKSFFVFPVLVFPGWFVTNTTNYNKNIWVINPKMLRGMIPKRPQSLSLEEMHMVSFHLLRFMKE